MGTLLRGSTSLPQVMALKWRALLLVAALISSQSCNIISDAPSRIVSTGRVSPAVSEADNPFSITAPTHSSPIEIPSTVEGDSPSETNETPPLARIPGPSQQTKTRETGLGSWYGPKFHGKRTASGEVFNQERFTAAHRSLPWGTRVKVTNLANGKSVDVRINDRGPFGKGRIIDVSRAAAKALDMVGRGVTTVQVEWLSDSETTREPVLQDR